MKGQEKRNREQEQQRIRKSTIEKARKHKRQDSRGVKRKRERQRDREIYTEREGQEVSAERQDNTGIQRAIQEKERGTNRKRKYK